MIFTKKTGSIHYFNSLEKYSYYHLGIVFSRILNDNKILEKDLIFICIGTDRATGDSLGPLLGNYLSAYPQTQYHVFGTLSNPVHAINLEDTIEEIYNMFKNPFIVALDAALGRKNHVGYSTIETGLLYPGQGINKKLPPIGDVAITGIVNISDSNDKYLLQTTRLNTVVKLCDHIFSGINYGLQLSGINQGFDGRLYRYTHDYPASHFNPSIKCPQ